MNIKMDKIKGLIAAPFTAFKEDGNVNLEVIPALAKNLIVDKVAGAYINGSTGEGISCSVEERIALMEAWKTASQNSLYLIAHTGALSLADVKILTRKAVELNYDAFSVIPPTFFRPETPQALAEYCATVAAMAPDMPFYFYHTMKSALPFPMVKFLEAADGKIPNLAGIKFNHYNLYDYRECLVFANGKYDIVYGVDEMFCAALATGAQGFIGSTYNYSAQIFLKLREAFQHSDWPKVWQLSDLVNQGVDILNQNGGIPAGKAMMLLKGVDCGQVRLPLKVLSCAERQKIARKMGEIVSKM